MKKTILMVASFAAASAALAHSGATGVVKERMDGMVALAQSMKALAGLARSADADPDQIKDIAQAIQVQSGHALTVRFPDGPLPPASEASPLIWQERARFTALSDELFDAAARLELAATSPALKLDDYIAELGATCVRCHQDFRIKK